MRVTVDTRDPWPHPWAKFLPEGWEFVREKLETGDVVLSALPEGAVIERKTPSDMAGCIGASRERFEKELKRGRYVGKLIVVIEGTLADVCAASRGISHNAITGTIAAWTLRYCPFVFCGSQQEAADFSFRFLAAQVRDAERLAKAISPLAVPPHLPARENPVAGLLAQKRPLPRVGVKSNYPEICQP
jgi:ERCC4-type nuclease